MSKAATEQLLQEFWAAKAKIDAERGHHGDGSMKAAGPRAGVADFLHQYLLSQADDKPRAAVEAGYNLLDALKRFNYDADCEIFHQCLFNELPEDAYHAQVPNLETPLSARLAMSGMGCSTNADRA